MSKDPKPVLGYIHCPDCGERGTVHQAAGKRHHLYKRCGCGCDQRNGKKVQSVLWYDTEWIPELKPEDPPAGIYEFAEYQEKIGSNPVSDTGADPVKPGAAEESEAAPAKPEEADFDTDIDLDPDGELAEQAFPKKSGLVKAVVGIFLLGGIGFLTFASKARG